MPIELNETDLAAVGKLQELKNTTIARAKEFYRLKVKQLANPDIPNRAEIVLENFLRSKNAADGDEQMTAPKQKKGPKAKKESKAKTAKKAKAPKKEAE